MKELTSPEGEEGPEHSPKSLLSAYMAGFPMGLATKRPFTAERAQVFTCVVITEETIRQLIKAR